MSNHIVADPGCLLDVLLDTGDVSLETGSVVLDVPLDTDDVLLEVALNTVDILLDVPLDAVDIVSMLPKTERQNRHRLAACICILN